MINKAQKNAKALMARLDDARALLAVCLPYIDDCAIAKGGKPEEIAQLIRAELRK